MKREGRSEGGGEGGGERGEGGYHYDYGNKDQHKRHCTSPGQIQVVLIKEVLWG